MKKFLPLLLALSLLISAFSGCSRVEFDLPSEKTRESAPETAAPLFSTEETEEETVTVEEGVSPLFWRVTAPNGNELYLFGTIHIGDDRTRQVLQLVRPYLKKCEALSVEVNVVEEENDEAALMQIVRMYLLTDGTTIKDHLPEDVYRDAVALCKEYGIDPAQYGYDRFCPAMWDQIVQQFVAELESDLDFDGGVDRGLVEWAQRYGIPVLEAEDPAAHYGFELKYPDWYFARDIRETLDSRDTYGEDLLKLYEAYLSGDQDAFSEEVNGELTEEDEAFIDAHFSEEEKKAFYDGDYSAAQVGELILRYGTDEEILDLTEYTREEFEVIVSYQKEMMDDRNEIILEAAKGYLNTYRTALLAVGAAHFEGGVGLVRLFEKAGFTVEEIKLNR